MIRLLLSLAFLMSLQGHASETAKGAQKDYDAFKKEMSVKIDSIEKELEELKQKAKTKGTTVKEETIHDLETTRDELKTKMSELSDASKDRWKSMKRKISETADSLHSKLQKALKD